MLSYLELVELANGDIVLQRADHEGEPLVVIRFSEESRQFMGVSPLEVARAMIQAGIEVASEDVGMAVEEELEDDEILDDSDDNNKTVH